MSASGRLRRIERSLKTLPRQWVESSAKTASKALTRSLTIDTGGDRSLSGAPKPVLRVKTKVEGAGTVVTGKVSPGPQSGMAQWTWLEEGTSPHKLGGKFEGAMHPGNAPKRTWTQVASKQVEAIRKDAEQRFARAVR